MIARLVVALGLCGTMAGAQDLDFQCHGSAPDWDLVTTPEGATFDFQFPLDLTLALSTLATGAEWPRAYTFIGRGGSAIVIVEQQMCGDQSYAARVLTQRGETPLLLTGCCTVFDPE